VVRAPGRRDALWAAEQVLRSRSCHALLGWFRRLGYRELRRLAVAAEGSPAWVALFRPREAARETSPAALRIAVEPEGGALAVRILKRRGAPAAAPLLVPVNRPFHVLGRPPFPGPAAGGARAARRLGVPVHA
jgi:protein ImuA